MTTERFERDQLVIEDGSFGLILAAGAVTYDIIWINGGTSRYRYSTGRHVRLAELDDFNGGDAYRERTIQQLTREATNARRERREGARIKRGQLWPSR